MLQNRPSFPKKPTHIYDLTYAAALFIIHYSLRLGATLTLYFTRPREQPALESSLCSPDKSKHSPAFENLLVHGSWRGYACDPFRVMYLSTLPQDCVPYKRGAS